MSSKNLLFKVPADADTPVKVAEALIEWHLSNGLWIPVKILYVLFGPLLFFMLVARPGNVFPPSGVLLLYGISLLTFVFLVIVILAPRWIVMRKHAQEILKDFTEPELL